MKHKFNLKQVMKFQSPDSSGAAFKLGYTFFLDNVKKYILKKK